MGIRRLNHAVLYVADADRSARFYEEVLGFRTVATGAGGRMRFLRAAASDHDHDLAVMGIGAGAAPSRAGSATVGLYHLAWEVGTLRELGEVHERLAAAGALVGASDHGTTKSIYARDPDHLELEVMWEVPPALLTAEERERGPVVQPLDLAAAVERFGADTPGAATTPTGAVPPPMAGDG